MNDAAFPAPIRKLLGSKRLERVAADRAHALDVLTMAEQHVRTATILADTPDQAMAFTAAYDGARKALTAVLAAHGLRARPVGGAHMNTGIAAAAFVTDDAVGDFEWMRQVRNATEYPSDDKPTASAQDVAEAIEAAGQIVAACRQYLET